MYFSTSLDNGYLWAHKFIYGGYVASSITSLQRQISADNTRKLLCLVYGQLSHITCPQSNASSQSLAPLVKAHNKLPILAAYLYLTVISISVAHCEIRLKLGGPVNYASLCS